tara:strand:- start:329 stop:1216 length:888 start_codon:yes stop_codon:yes gene_type:complete
MTNKNLPLHIGQFLDKTTISLGVLLFLIGTCKALYNSPKLSISDIAMSFSGILIWLLFKSRLFTNLLGSPKARKKVAETSFTVGCITSVTIILTKVLFGQSQFYRNSLDENSLVEWLTFLLLAISSYIFFCLSKTKGKRIEKFFCIATSGSLFIASMEELSWGQMVFNWGTPKGIAVLNSQGETTIHNLYIINKLVDPLLLCALSIAILLSLFGTKIKENLNQKTSILDIVLPSNSTLPVLSLAWIIVACILLFSKDGPFQSGEIEWAELLISLAASMHSIQLTIDSTPKEVLNQ